MTDTLRIHEDHNTAIELIKAEANGRGNGYQLASLIENNKEIINYHDVDRGGESLLHLAAFVGADQSVGILLDNGANANHKNNNGFTARQCSQARGHHEISRTIENAEESQGYRR